MNMKNNQSKPATRDELLKQKEPTEDAATLSLGKRLRALRRARKMSLAEFASATGKSIGYLSQIERDLSSPTVRELSAFATVLDVDLLDVIAGSREPECSCPVRRSSAITLMPFRGDAIVKRVLTPENRGKIRLFLMIMEPGASTGEQPYSHAGEEAGYVISGAFDLTVENVVYHLEEGDSFRFSSSTPHAFTNTEKGQTTVLWINIG
jgi:transcriptional regulator with XRE-family HTH domain